MYLEALKEDIPFCFANDIFTHDHMPPFFENGVFIFYANTSLLSSEKNMLSKKQVKRFCFVNRDIFQ